MTAEEIRRMEERVAQVRAEMERACRAAGRAPGEVLLCAASKTQNSETVRAAAALDIDLFGENRVQELCENTPPAHTAASRCILSAICRPTRCAR